MAERVALAVVSPMVGTFYVLPARQNAERPTRLDGRQPPCNRSLALEIVVHGKGSSEMHMLLVNLLLGFAAISAWVLMWFIPFRQQVYRWLDEHWPF